MLKISLKYRKRVAPEVQISGQNSKFLQFWGLYSHISATINVKYDTGERTCGPLPPLPLQNFTFIGATCRPCGANHPFLDL